MAKQVKYKWIAEEIRAKIRAGEYPKNTAIPTELQLANTYAVSRHTIRQAIAELTHEGYVRSEKGSGTYVSQSYLQKDLHKPKTIGVITTYVSDYIFPSIIRGIEHVLSENNYSLLLASTNNHFNQEKRCLTQMLNYGVDGIIVEPTKSNEYNPNLTYYLALKEKQIPFVMLNASYEELVAPAITVDDVRAGFLATDYLFQTGCRRIGLVTKIDDLQGKNRMKGFIQAHAEHGSTFAEQTILTYRTETKKSIKSKISQLLTAGQVDGIVCYNDEIAVQVVQLCTELHLKIPEDVAIVGQDDSPLSISGEIKLTTISHPKEQLGRAAGNWMVQAIDKGQQPASIVFPPELIIRESTGSIQQ